MRPRSPQRERKWLRFDETMRGELAFDVQDPNDAAGAPEAARFRVALRLTIEGEADLFLADPRHEAGVTGYVESAELGGKRPIVDGTFNLFTYGADPDRRKMHYRIRFRDGAGHMFTLRGEKFVPKPPPRHPWRDTSTMFTRLIRERGAPDDGAGEEIAAAGILRVPPSAVLRELVTMRASSVGVVVRLFAFFLGVVARIYVRR